MRRHGGRPGRTAPEAWSRHMRKNFLAAAEGFQGGPSRDVRQRVNGRTMRTTFVWVSSTHDATAYHMDGAVAGVAAAPPPHTHHNHPSTHPPTHTIHAAMRSGWALGGRLCQRASVVEIRMTRMQQQRRVTGKLRAVAYRMCLEQTMWPHGVATKDQHGQFYIPSQKVFSLRPHAWVCLSAHEPARRS